MSGVTRLPLLAARVAAQSPNSGLNFLAGGGEMGSLIRAKDWSQTPLGPIEGWSPSLRMMLSFLLANRFPLLLWWGPDYISIYNDAYRPVLGTKHPWALGQPFRDCWAEIKDVLIPLIDAPFHGGPPTWMDDLPLEINRHGFLEETHFTVAYSPVPDDTAPRGIGGVLATVHEITEKIVGERRLAALRDLGARAGEAKSPEHSCVIAAAALSNHAKDIPFALIYLVDPTRREARLAGAAGVEPGAAVAPFAIQLDQSSEDTWPLPDVLRADTTLTLTDISHRFAQLPAGPWSDPAQSAVLVPMKSTVTHEVTAFLIAGVSPRLRLDEQYLGFFDLVAAQVSSAIANARAYEDERRRAEALAEIDDAKTKFFSNVSHEFRTPLTLMIGPLQEAAANADTPASVRTQLELVQRNSLRLLKLVNTLLDFSRIEAGRVQASYEPTDLAVFCSDLASTFRSTIERAGLGFVVECECLEEPVYVDREMWEKIVLNLLSNAFKFTLQGEVAVRLRRETSNAVLEVADTGVGVPEHELPRLFERFHRVEGTTGRTLEGSGIGLALVQELVTLHGGTISAASELGVGTTFRVEIPFGRGHLRADRIRTSPAQSASALGAQAFVQEALRWTPATGQEIADRLSTVDAQQAPGADRRFVGTAGARIVLADDNADMRAYVCGLLAPMYHVEPVADGQQALDAARGERPDLILSDVMMPRLDGLALLKELRSDEALRDVPVIILSARAGEEARVGGLDAGADDYLVKPFSARELLARVGSLLELTKLRQQSDAQFRTFVNATADAVYRMSPDWSEMRFLQGHNFIADTATPTANWLEKYIHPADQVRVMQVIGGAIRSRRAFEFEHRVRRVDGTVGWTFSRAIPVTDDTGEIVEWFGTATDVTERKWVEESLQGQRRILERIASGAPLRAILDELMLFLEAQEIGARCALLIVSDDGQHMRRGSGPSLSESYHQVLDGVAVTRPYFGAFAQAVDRDEPVVVHDVRADTCFCAQWRELLLANGIRALRATPVHGTDGRVLASLIIYFAEPRDPTPVHPQLIEIGSHLAAIGLERARTEAAQHAAQAALQRADRQKDEFLAMLAHELRNPLAPIGNASEILARRLVHDRGSTIQVEMIKRQARQLTRLVDDLLDVSRITQGRIQLQQAPVDLASVVTQAVETVEPQMRDKQHRLALSSSRGYEPVYVNGDFARLVQCVVNMLSNAAKYTDPCGDICVSMRADGASAVIEISDNGAGIPPELLPRVFDLFVQNERTLDRAQGGLGIGLAVVKRLIEMHGGQVQACSAGHGQGATFTIMLPRIGRPAASLPHCVQSVTRSRRVLVVDDNKDAADSLAALLCMDGHETTALYSAQEALERIDTLKPDVILLDLGLPEMNGYELASHLRATPRWSGLRLVALTGYGQLDDLQRTRAIGFDDHLVKPVDMAALARALVGPEPNGAPSQHQT
jgi:signal transduction histidine kinase/DNA-binding response OmpR family regulator